MTDIRVKCTRCRHECMESEWVEKRIPTSHGIGMSVYVCPKCGCKSYYNMQPMIAWCWANGVIEVGECLPEDGDNGGGVIHFATGPKSSLRQVVGTLARQGYSGQMLVPGVPEASTPKEAIKALIDWVDWAVKGNGQKHRHGVVFYRNASEVSHACI